MNFRASIVHLSDAFRFIAYVFEGRKYARSGSTFDHIKAKAAFAR